jgi:hypothetical protein
MRILESDLAATEKQKLSNSFECYLKKLPNYYKVEMSTILKFIYFSLL